MWKAICDKIEKAADEEYPGWVHIPHSFFALAGYRTWRQHLGEPNLWLYDIVLSFFSHSQGSGAWCTSILEGKSLWSYCARYDYSHYHFLVYLATYWSPRDIVYRWMTTPWHPLKLFCTFIEGIDGVTTTAGLVDDACKSQKANKLLPIIAGIALYNTGGFFRHLDCLSRGEKSSTFLSKPGGDVTRGVLVGLVYWFFGHIYQQGRQRRRALVALTILESLLEVLEDMYDFDAYEKLHLPGLAVLRWLRKHLALGPPPRKTSELEDKKQ